MLLTITRLLLATSWFLSVVPALPAGARRSGIEGYIFRVSGNRMPSPNTPLPAPKGLRTTLYIYELTTLDQVDRLGHSPFYREIRTRPVRSVLSDESGYFFVSLPPGQYSLFTRKDSLFYANIFDGQNHIAPVTVSSNKVAQMNVNVDYDAAY